MLQTIESSLKSAEDADSIVSDVEQILDVVTEDEKKDIIDAVRNNFDHYKKKLVELDPGLADRIGKIEKRK